MFSLFFFLIKPIYCLFAEFYATMPGLDTFVTMEKSQRIRNFLEVSIFPERFIYLLFTSSKLYCIANVNKSSNLQSLVVGDVIYAQVMSKSAPGLLLKVLCNCSDCPRVVTELGIKVYFILIRIFLILPYSQIILSQVWLVLYIISE